MSLTYIIRIGPYTEPDGDAVFEYLALIETATGKLRAIFTREISHKAYCDIERKHPWV
jgi:hypothetical protein